jgi:hypothetical protein
MQRGFRSKAKSLFPLRRVGSMFENQRDTVSFPRALLTRFFSRTTLRALGFEITTLCCNGAIP